MRAIARMSWMLRESRHSCPEVETHRGASICRTFGGSAWRYHDLLSFRETLFSRMLKSSWRCCHSECPWAYGPPIEMKVNLMSPPRKRGPTSPGGAGFPLPRFRGGQASRE